jgi:hypothetical protein
MSVEKIEYYLGKDEFKDVYFKPEFPAAYADVHSKKIVPEQYTSSVLKINEWYPEIEFKFNNLGYRSTFDYSVESLKGKKIILCLGCTDTFGMNLHYKDIWPTKLANQFADHVVLNLGIIGAGCDTVARVFTKITQVLGQEIVAACIFWPHNNRREFVSKEFTGIITSHDGEAVPFEDYWDFIDWKSDNYNIFKNKHMVANIARANDIKLFDLTINRFDKRVPFDFAGNYYALGTDSHQAIANYFYKKIVGLPSVFENGQQN